MKPMYKRVLLKLSGEALAGDKGFGINNDVVNEIAVAIKKIQEMFQGWFSNSESNYNAFIKAMLWGNVKEMNTYMNEVAPATFSSFDTGRHPSGKSQPERFYHGFVLGLLVELRDRYEVKSNRESGYG